VATLHAALRMCMTGPTTGPSNSRWPGRPRRGRARVRTAVPAPR